MITDKTYNGEKIFIRFGLLRERSINHITNKPELGLSVYECIYDDDSKTYRIIFPHLTESACVSLSGFDKPYWYLVTGDVCGYGSDGEPLLCNVKTIERKPPIYGKAQEEEC